MQHSGIHSSKGGSRGGLIVRVKRRRDQEPSDSLCIVEDADLAPAAKTTKRAARGPAGPLIDSLAATSLSAVSAATTAGSAGAGVGAGGAAMPAQKRLLLQRVNTVNHATDGTGHDTAVASLKRLRSRSLDQDLIDEGATGGNGNGSNSSKGRGSAPSLLITRGKKLLRGNDGSSFVIVDLAMQAVASATTAAAAAAAPAVETEAAGIHRAALCGSMGSGSSSSAPVRTAPTAAKVLLADPPTRRLQEALDAGFAPSVAPAQVSAALQTALAAVVQGAKVEHPRPNGGQTVLMLAARSLNVRAAERLIARGASVYTADADGRTALDYAYGLRGCPVPGSGGSSSRSGVETFVLLLNRTAAAHPVPVFVPDSSAGGSTPFSQGQGGGDVETQDAYVFDIFTMPAADEHMHGRQQHAPKAGEEAEEGPESSENDAYMAPLAQPTLMVQVPGLRLAQDGNAELVFAYDSDWSDLGDDEDPDSNDERCVCACVCVLYVSLSIYMCSFLIHSHTNPLFANSLTHSPTHYPLLSRQVRWK